MNQEKKNINEILNELIGDSYSEVFKNDDLIRMDVGNLGELTLK